MSAGQRGLDTFTCNVLREFHIADPEQANAGACQFIRDKFKAGYSISATIRDLRAELHAQMLANAASVPAGTEDSLV